MCMYLQASYIVFHLDVRTLIDLLLHRRKLNTYNIMIDKVVQNENKNCTKSLVMLTVPLLSPTLTLDPRVPTHPREKIILTNKM